MTLALACAALLAWAAPQVPAKATRPGADTLVVGLLGEPLSLDPQRATDIVSAAVTTSVCEPLVRTRPDGVRVEGALAETWASRDSVHWTLTLRADVRFHDGTRFDADAVVANLEALRRRGVFAGRAERVGALVVDLTLEQPNVALLATLSQPWFAMQSPRALGTALPVGTGPFRLASQRPGHYELHADPGYWGGAPRLRRVVFERLPDEHALVAALLSGHADVTAAVGLGHAPELQRAAQVTFEAQVGLNVVFLSVNNERPALRDRRVRQALARALDRDALVTTILHGHGASAQAPLPPSLAPERGRGHRWVPDRAGARRLLGAAGFGEGLLLELLVPQASRPYLPTPRLVGQGVQRDLEAVGLHTRLVEVAPWSAYIERCTRGDYDLALLGWQADSLDPNDFLSALLSSSNVGLTNRSRYRSAAMDALLQRGRRASDATQRASVYREAERLFQVDVPWVPLYHASTFTAYRKSVQGLSVGPTGILRYDKAWKTE